MIKIHNWCTVPNTSSPYRAPETISVCMKGNVYGHRAFEDGASVKTSRVKSAHGRVITTVSGSVYLLGRIDPKFRKFLKNGRPDWNWRKPITIMS
jgi:hypothetical protein